MAICSNPVQCQTAKREECTCACSGANHGILRKMLENPDTHGEAEQRLEELKELQAEMKKAKKVERRKKRAEKKKST